MKNNYIHFKIKKKDTYYLMIENIKKNVLDNN